MPRPWLANAASRPHYPRGTDAAPILQEAEWALRQVWTAAENLIPTGIRSPDRPPVTWHLTFYQNIILSTLCVNVFLDNIHNMMFTTEHQNVSFWKWKSVGNNSENTRNRKLVWHYDVVKNHKVLVWMKNSRHGNNFYNETTTVSQNSKRGLCQYQPERRRKIDKTHQFVLFIFFYIYTGGCMKTRCYIIVLFSHYTWCWRKCHGHSTSLSLCWPKIICAWLVRYKHISCATKTLKNETRILEKIKGRMCSGNAC
jgi:hypothetical protein